MIYLDNAATTKQKPECVGKTMIEAINMLGNAGRGATTASLDAARLIYDTRVRLARLFHIENPNRVAFTSNATESLNTAIKGVLQSGDHVVTTVLEHNSVLRPLYEMAEKNVELSFAKTDAKGQLNYNQIETMICENTKAIICTHGSNLTGNLVDIKKIGAIARKRNLLFIVDASQTAGVFPINVEEMNIDILCFTGHKGLLGPQGTGGIYVREGVEIKSLKTGGTGIDTYNKKQPAMMPTLLEAGTLNGHGIAGLHAALGYIEEVGMDYIRKKEMELMWKFYNQVKDIAGVKLYGDYEHLIEGNRAPIVALNLWDYDSGEVSDELLVTYQIATRSGGHCAPLMHQELGTVEQGAVRFSFSHYNTTEEVTAAVEAIKELSKEKIIEMMEQVINGEGITFADAMELYKGDLQQLKECGNRIRAHYCGNTFDMCTIINAKSGRCSEDCKYCAQSVYHNTTCEEYPLLNQETLIQGAVDNGKKGVLRYSLVTSGRNLSDQEIEAVCNAAVEIKKQENIKLCASFGLLTHSQYEKIRKAGIERIHNNLETSEAYFSEMCTTHTFQDKVLAIKEAEKAGLFICSGGIFGIGERVEDRVSLAFALKELNINSIPINMLSPIKGTPYENNQPITSEELCRIVAVFRFILPQAFIRLAGGRGLLKDKGRQAFMSGANATITGDMLTTSGYTIESDMSMVKEMGYIVKLHENN